MGERVLERIPAPAEAIGGHGDIERGVAELVADGAAVAGEAIVLQRVQGVAIDVARVGGAEGLRGDDKARRVAHEAAAHPERRVARRGVDGGEPVAAQGPRVGLHVEHVAVEGVGGEGCVELRVAAAGRGEVSEDVEGEAVL